MYRICTRKTDPGVWKDPPRASNVITAVFILGVLNLCLGFVLTAYAEQASARLVALLTAGHKAPQPQLPGDTRPAAPTLAPKEPEASLHEARSLPSNWRRVLRENRIKVESATEALLWTFKLELSTLREQLVQLENQLEKTGHVAMVLGSWRGHHQEWITCLDEFAKVLTSANDDFSHDDIDASLRDLLQDHQFDVQQTETSLNLISDVNGKETQTGSTNNSGAIGRQLSEQIHEFHTIRDRVDKFLATFLRENGRLDDVDESQQIEGATEIYNRIGFEVICQQWRNADPKGEQPACCLLVDIDRFSQKNEKFGNKTGDIIIAAFGDLLRSLLRVERGFDRVARFNGHSFLIFLGHTTLDDASVVAERTRQCIEATSFEVGSDSFHVTTSLGLVELAPPELDLAEFYRMLQEAVASAKAAGRNRTCVLRDHHSEIAATEPIQVKGRVIEIAECE